MAETEVVIEDKKEETVIPGSPFKEENWQTVPQAVVTDPAIKEKDEKIKEEKPESTKPDEPDKIPGASPKPIQGRPDDVKEDVKPFANEESEKVFNLLKEGKTDVVLSILAEQKKLSEVDKLPPQEIIKLNLQYSNKDFSPEDINELFEERYALPEKPEQGYETDDEFKPKLAKYEKEVERIENRIKRDAKPAMAELLKLQKEIVLPDIQKTQSGATEPTQEELEAQKLLIESFSKSIDEGLQKFHGYETTFKDEEVELKVAYVASEEEKQQIKPLIALSQTNAGEFLTKIGWLDENGNINTAKLTEDLPLILDKGKVFQKIASETGNKRHEASIKGIKNIDYSEAKKSNGDLGLTPQQMQDSMVQHFFSQ